MNRTPAQPSGWLTPRAAPRGHLSKGQNGVYAVEPIREGDIVAVWGGSVVAAMDLYRMDRDRIRLALQIEEDLYIVSDVEGPSDWVNHSCEPNTGVMGAISLVALRPIDVGEEICFDYAMTDGSPYDEFECCCGAPSCRRRITGNDWERAELWDVYGQHFSPYLLRRIAARRRFTRRRRSQKHGRIRQSA